MIPARKSRWFARWFAEQARARLRRSFHEVRVAGLADVREAARGSALLFVANHTAWWDPLVALWASELVLGLDAFAMMDAKNLRRLPFFALVGGFGVDLDRKEDGASAIRHAARLLDRPGRAVWIFPQGRERPVDARPLDFRAGSAEIARVARVPAIPVALRYEHGREELPRLVVSFGPRIEPARDVVAGRVRHEEAVTAELDRVAAALASERLDGFETLERATPRRLDVIAERALVGLVRLHARSTGVELEAPGADAKRLPAPRDPSRRE